MGKRPASRVREVWERGECVLSCWAAAPSLAAVEMIGSFDFDAVIFDTQHGAIDARDVYTLLAGLRDSEATPMVRVPWNDPTSIMRALDVGCEGIVCPVVDTPEQTRDLVRACRYPPEGIRSWGPVRGTLADGPMSYFEGASDRAITLAQIESVEAMNNLPGIVATPGLDAVYVGLADLALTEGRPPVIDYADARTADSCRQIVEACHGAGVKAGFVALQLDDVPLLLDWGADLITVASDVRILSRGCSDALQEARGAVREHRKAASA